ncbi:MAG: hypothetical protein K9K65_04195 [Desulfarculaceae bacterium]|nr:hypothetical protein [Desulfarculaceae bacterium]MCF8097021.1 hypothetical protein [Desulfarculaceae bacterium]MCF8122073.1 hypothetical protein [Desulfarculaceae bacterium]
MQRQASSGWTDEERLTRLRDQLHEHAGPKGQSFWLTLARLSELALWWAGCLADAGEFQAVGDLLLNPPRKTLYVRDRPVPLRLVRHEALTEQVRGLAPAGANLPLWLKSQTMLVIEVEPLLPLLLGDLSRWPHRPPKTCRDFQLRLDRVAGALCHITSLNLAEGASVAEHLARVPQEEARAIKRHLCRFDLGRFDALGLALRDVLPSSAPITANGQGAPLNNRAPLP